MKRILFLLLFSVLCISTWAFTVRWYYKKNSFQTDVCQTLSFRVISNTEVAVSFGVRSPDLSIQVDSSRIEGYDLYIPATITYEGRTFTVTEILPGAFCRAYECNKQYKSVYIPNTIKTIGEDAFRLQDKIEKIVVPNSVKSIGRYAFDSNSLKEFVLGNSVKIIKEAIFLGASGISQIKKITCLSVTPPEVKGALGYIGSKVWCDIIVPKGCIDAYKQAPYWKDFAVIHELDSLTYIPEGYTCEPPTIEYKDGTIYYTDIPEDGQVITKILADDSKETNTSTVDLSGTYHISAYTARPGWNNSDVSEATLVYAIDNDNTGIETISVKTTPLFIKKNGNILSVYGLTPGQNFTVYSVDGTEIYSSTVSGTFVNLDVQHLLNKTIILNVNNRTAKYFVK